MYKCIFSEKVFLKVALQRKKIYSDYVTGVAQERYVTLETPAATALMK